jgi:hypothetical protein
LGAVLTNNHGITNREKELYASIGFADLTPEETNLLISQCEAKLAQYLEKRGEKVWQHRTLAAAYISAGVERISQGCLREPVRVHALGVTPILKTFRATARTDS